MGRLLGAYLEQLAEEVVQSAGYRVMPGVEALLPRLTELGIMLGIVSGALEAAAHIKLGRARLNRFFTFGGYGSDSADRAELTRAAILRVASCTATGSTRRGCSSSGTRRATWRQVVPPVP